VNRVMRRWARILIAAAVCTIALPGGAAAGIFLNVNSTADEPDVLINGICATADGECTLRAAVQEINAAMSFGQINIAAGKYTLKLVGAGEDLAATGDLDVLRSVVIVGAGASTTIIKGKKDRVFHVHPGINLTIRDLSIRNGSVGKKDDIGDEFNGGGILNDVATLTLERVNVTGNKSSDDGGGIANLGGDLSLTDVTIAKNKAADDGGGVDNDGGGVELVRVTISQNKAGDEGGGVESDDGQASFENTTISGNVAKDNSGGVSNEDGSTTTIANSTIKGNKAPDGGGILNELGSTLTLASTVLDKNKQTNCSGTITSDGGNVESGTSCGFSPPDLSNVPKLKIAGLKANGGFTKTHALKEGSPAIDAGKESCPATDQRGAGRVDVPGVGTHICDSGAFEFQPE